MLLIGDIHANTKHIDTIITEIRKYVQAHTHDQDVIFLGDYMYMFSYDRGALAKVFDLFLEIREMGKSVYILAGNHDWLSDHFIYQEGKKISDKTHVRTGRTDGKSSALVFITEPAVYTIQGQRILFFPYNKQFLQQVKTNEQTKAKEIQEHIYQKNTDIAHTIQELSEKSNAHEQLSAALNAYLLEHYEPGMTLIHHYYTADISFPGQKAVFDYKDIALHPGRTTYASGIISGHLHKAFLHESYLCVGSVRSTMSNEADQCKRLWQRDVETDTYKAREIAINPYYTFFLKDETPILEKDDIIVKQQQRRNAHKALFPPQVQRVYDAPFSPGQSSILLYTNNTTAQVLTSLDPDIIRDYKDIQLKHVTTDTEDMTHLLDLSHYTAQKSLLDRKELVKKYIMSRYGTESDKYRTLLSELGIL